MKTFKVILFSLFTIFFINNTVQADTLLEGQTMFQSRCAVCHTIGGGRLVGPDLAGVQTRRTDDWLTDFIQSSTSMINKGDKTAIEIFEAFNKMPMPDQNISESQIKSILTYIQSKEGVLPASDKKKITPLPIKLNPKKVQRGAALFQGVQHFSNQGPSCISCHTATFEGVQQGGNFAKDLTHVASRIGKKGVQAILKSPPFPAMKISYEKHPLTEEEIEALSSFLQAADTQGATIKEREIVWTFLLWGGVGCVLLLGLYALLWMKRKKRSVNQALFDRQISSEGES